MPELTTEFIDYCYELYEAEGATMDFYKYLYKEFYANTSVSNCPITYFGEFTS